jgi:hypothetical protein
MKKSPIVIWSLSAVIYLGIVLAGYYGYVAATKKTDMNHNQMKMSNHQQHEKTTEGHSHHVGGGHGEHVSP